MKQDRYTKSARGKECQIRVPGCCLSLPDNVVLAHLGGAGMAMKHLNIHGSYACDNCHRIVDGRIKTVFDKDQLKHWHLEGVIRTQIIMVQDGILKL